MKEKNDKEFLEFLKSEGGEIPTELTQQIHKIVHEDFNPSFPQVFFKLSGLHVLTGGLTVLVCPQLGVGPLFYDIGLMQVFMQFGSVACAALCGVFFMSLTAIGASFIFRPEEVKKLKSMGLSAMGGVSALSLMALMVLGAELSLEVLAWAAAGIMAGKLLVDSMCQFRFRHLRLSPKP